MHGLASQRVAVWWKWLQACCCWSLLSLAAYVSVLLIDFFLNEKLDLLTNYFGKLHPPETFH